MPLLISWRWGWWEAWVYAVISIMSFVVSRALAARRHPDLIAERAHFVQHENTKHWDNILAPLTGLGGVLVLLIAGLDARLDWSPGFSLPVKTLALVMILAGYALGSLALIENRFFSGTVRIQTERGHQIVSSGPYRWIRHPGYAGALLTYLATPLFLDSGWVFLPTVFITILLVIRTTVIRLISKSLNLTFGIFTWKVPPGNVAECHLDEIPVFMRMGGAGIHSMMTQKRHRASFNFLEYP